MRRHRSATPLAISFVVPRRGFLLRTIAAAGTGVGALAGATTGPVRLVSAAGLGAPGGADQPDPRPVARVADWDVPNGHFYTQAAPPDAAADTGFVVADADGVRFWRDYKGLGGPAQLGFPMSQRYDAGGIEYQVMQAGLLRWNPPAGGADIMPVFIALTELDLDDWLEARGIPRTAPELLEDPALPPTTRLSWLTHPTLRAAYLDPDETAGLARFGLPMSEPERFGPYLAQRFEKTVLQLWLDNVPGQPPAGSVTAIQTGELLEDAGLIPPEALVPMAAPAPRPNPLPVTPAGTAAPAPAIVSGHYVVVSLGRQWWYGYQDGQLVNSGPVTTGQPLLVTPPGRFFVMSKHSPYTMISPWGPGSPFYYPPSSMSFALRITSNGIFLHDAPWRPYYGPGTNVPHYDPDGVWRTGSHGCINMPYTAAAWLYRWASAGMPVDVIS